MVVVAFFPSDGDSDVPATAIGPYILAAVSVSVWLPTFDVIQKQNGLRQGGGGGEEREGEVTFGRSWHESTKQYSGLVRRAGW